MKRIVAVFATSLLLCGSAAFAQTAPGSVTPGQAQSAVDTLKSMPAEQRKQMIESGVDQVGNLTPEQLKQYKSMYDSLPPEQKQQLESQIMQQLDSDPKLKADAEKKLQNLTPEQKQQLSQ